MKKNNTVATAKNGKTTTKNTGNVHAKANYMPTQEELQAREDKRKERREKQEAAQKAAMQKATEASEKKAENLKNAVDKIPRVKTVPTGVVIDKTTRDARRKAREEQYRNFRINALKRRAKRMGLSEEQTNVKVEELKKQLDTPNSYNVLILFNPKDLGLVKQAMDKEGLVWKMKSDSHIFMDADQETLATIRSIMPPSAKIHPYVKKKPPVLPQPEPTKAKAKPRTKAEKKALAKAAKTARKKKNIEAHYNHKVAVAEQKKKRIKAQRKLEKAHKLFQKRVLKASEKKDSTIIQLKPKKASNASKKASTTIKKAA